MCGIVGIFDLYGKREFDPSLLHRMNQAQLHRGPDEGGQHLEPGIALGHRRLSIIDLASGQQPLFNEDHTVAVVFNGEIYNFQALAGELARHGHVFRTRCDTEVIVHAWEQWGERCVEHFRGMFAFALWDRNRQTLFLARDRLGVKPLYYAMLEDGSVAFASELKALLVHPKFRRQLDPHAIEDYFAYGYVPDPKTIFSQAHKLAPGHTLTLCRGCSEAPPRSFWDVSFTPHANMREDQACEELLARLREAVSIRLMAEVPLGAFLSGGVDSSAVVALMAQLSSTPVNTCSIGFNDPAFDESEYATMVATRYRTAHRTQIVDAGDNDLVDTLAALYDEPFADSSAIPTYRVCQLAGQHVTVVLSGDGGDEILAGYRRYRHAVVQQRVRQHVGAPVCRHLFGFLGRHYPKADWAPRVFRAKTTFESLALDPVAGYFHSVSLVCDQQRNALFSDAFRRDLQGYHAMEVLRRHAQAAPQGDPLSFIQYLDLKTWLPGDILVKVDRASMAHGVEVRNPLLDQELVEWTSGLPMSFKLRGPQGKHVLKRALEPHLPREVLYRKKMGFSIPLASWFRGPLRTRVRDALAGDVIAGSGLFNMGTLAVMLDQHDSGQFDHSTVLWSLFMFDAFLRNIQFEGLSAAAPNAHRVTPESTLGQLA